MNSIVKLLPRKSKNQTDGSRASRAVVELFVKYEAYSQKGDYRKLAKLYGSEMMIAGPSGIEFHHNNIFTRWQYNRSMKSFYGNTGLTSIKLEGLSEEVISNSYSMVSVDWSAVFNKGTVREFEFTVSYLIRFKKRGGTEIVAAIAHQDEKKILEGYGLI